MRSRIGILMLVSCLLFAAAGSAGAAKTKRSSPTRVVELRYEGGAVPFVMCMDCPETFSRPTERYVTVEIIDDVSPVGFVDIGWHSGGHDAFPVCGKTSEPMKIPAGSELTVYPWVVPDLECPNGFSTSGTIKLTFSKRP